MKLTDSEKQILDEMPTIGYWPALNGVELKKVEHGIDDYCICRLGSWNSKPTYHRVKVRYAKFKGAEPKPYIILYYEKLYLSDCIQSLI